MSSDLTIVSFDIETTGFSLSEMVTTMGLVLPLGCRVFLNTEGRSVEEESVEARLESKFETPVNLSAHHDEREMFIAFESFADERLAPGDYLIAAYNGDRFRSGFDLPFLRSRLSLLDTEWPFVNVPYTDLLPIFDARFNTNIGEDEVKDLERVYDALVGGKLTAADPFDDSSEAVEAFHRGDFEALLQHNVADILRTDALASLAERYCSRSEFKLKSLTPAKRRT